VAHVTSPQVADLLKAEIDKADGKPTPAAAASRRASAPTSGTSNAVMKRPPAPPLRPRASLGGAGKSLLQATLTTPAPKPTAAAKTPTPRPTASSARATTSATKASAKSSGGDESGSAGGLKVVVRKRPAWEGEEDCVGVVGGRVVVRENKVKVDLTKYVKDHVFLYDDAFGDEATTGDLYERAQTELVDNFFRGGTSTCFCFGQTASGKTFTLFGANGGQGEAGGIYMLAAEDVFGRLEGRPELQLCVSMFEIYGQKVRDLLCGGKELPALEDGNGVLQLVGLSLEAVDTLEEYLVVSATGRGERATTVHP
jgi:kinesin family protein 2/24